MQTIEANNTVTIIYTGKLDNGAVFQTATREEPMTIKMGNQDAPPTLEEALMGMAIGDKKTVRIDPAESYGPRVKDLLQKIKRENLGKSDEEIKPGTILSLTVERDGQKIPVPATVVEVKGDIITIDYNHPLAGHHLTYDLEVIEIIK